MKRRPAAPSAHPDLPFDKPLRRVRLSHERKERENAIFARAGLRSDVLDRSLGLCENPGCAKPLAGYGYEMDHWLNGTGRRTQAESIQTLWALCSSCHAARHANVPSASYWNERHRTFCERHGYPFTPHLTRIQAFKLATAPSAPREGGR